MNLRCDWYRRQLGKHAAWPDSLRSGSPLARHLESCDGCRAVWAALRRFGAELPAALPVPPPSESFEDGIWRRIASATPRRSTPRIPALAPGVAAVTVAASAGLLYLCAFGAAPRPTA